jgi:hypothetical protein
MSHLLSARHRLPHVKICDIVTSLTYVVKNLINLYQ